MKHGAAQKHEREAARAIEGLHPEIKTEIITRGSTNAHKWLIATLGTTTVRLVLSSSPTNAHMMVTPASAPSLPRTGCEPRHHAGAARQVFPPATPTHQELTMSHELDTTTGRVAMAYATGSQKPWHGLGTQIPAEATVQEWREAAGLDWECKRTPVYFHQAEGQQPAQYEGKDVLYRGDTLAPLSVVSADYQIAQPAQVMDFFEALSTQGGFQMETAGVLFEGRRIWALARVGVDVEILDDTIAPYLMLATSYDGTMSTFAQFTSVRVVCNNTLQASLSNTKAKYRIAIPHSAMFNPKTLADDLMLSEETWTGFADVAKALAKHQMTETTMDTYLQALLAGPDKTEDSIRRSKGYKRILELFNGAQIGARMKAIKGTAWGALNATTQYIDHEVGRIQDNRLDSAWFGDGARVKGRAAALLTSIAEAA